MDELVVEDEFDTELPAVEIEEDEEGLAKYYIDLFFKDRQMHYGGNIPKHYLTLPDFVNLVINTDICNGIDECYYRLGKTEMLEDAHISDDVRMLIDILGECAKAGIPKQFASGIALMYLELCKGVKRPSESPKLNTFLDFD